VPGSTRVRLTVLPLAQLAADAVEAHQAVRAATSAASAAAAERIADVRRTRAQARGERLAAIEARNKHATAPAE
jgi:hypothetical protein